MPNMRVLAPSDEAELACALHTALQIGGPVAVRYPRGAGVGVDVPVKPTALPLGVSREVRSGDDVALLAFGDRVEAALGAAQILAEKGIDARVVDMRWVKPLDEAAIARAAQTKLIVTIENGSRVGGAGEGVLQILAQQGVSVSAKLLGLPDEFVVHGKTDRLFAEMGLDAQGIAETVLNAL